MRTAAPLYIHTHTHIHKYIHTYIHKSFPHLVLWLYFVSFSVADCAVTFFFFFSFTEVTLETIELNLIKCIMYEGKPFSTRWRLKEQRFLTVMLRGLKGWEPVQFRNGAMIFTFFHIDARLKIQPWTQSNRKMLWAFGKQHRDKFAGSLSFKINVVHSGHIWWKIILSVNFDKYFVGCQFVFKYSTF